MIIDGQLYIYNGTTWEALRRPDKIKVLSSTSLANNASGTIWTPTSGKTINLMGLIFSFVWNSVMTANRLFQLYDGGTLIGEFSIWYVPIILNFPNSGHKFAAADNVLTVKNICGATQSVALTAWGYET